MRSSKRQDLVDSLFESMMQIPIAKRKAFLNQVDGLSPDIRQRVEELIRIDRSLDSQRDPFRPTSTTVTDLLRNVSVPCEAIKTRQKSTVN